MNIKRQTEKCVLSCFLNSPGLETTRKSSDQAFRADGPAYAKARSPNLVRSRGGEKSVDDVDRRPRRVSQST